MSAQQPWIFLRGLMRDGRHWGKFPGQFATALHSDAVHLIDLPGNGTRHRQQSPVSVPATAAWLRDALRQQGLRPPYQVFAMSLGAMVTVAWADSHPQEIARAVLVNTSLKPVSPFHQRLQASAWPLLLRMALLRPSARSAEQAILRLTSRHHADDMQLLEQWTEWRKALPVARANALRQLMAAARFQAPLHVHCPLLLLNGAGDQLVSPECSAALARRWQCPLRVHPSAGHDLPLDDPQWVIAQVRGWS